MTLAMDIPKTPEQRMAERMAFRDEFLKDIPVGTLVENLVLENTDQGKPRTGTTAPGLIYEEELSECVNVVDIDGKNGLSFGVWTAAFVRKIEEKASENIAIKP